MEKTLQYKESTENFISVEMWTLCVWLSAKIIGPELTVIFLNYFLQVALQGWTPTRKHTIHWLCTLKINSKRHQGKNPSIYEGKFNFL